MKDEPPLAPRKRHAGAKALVALALLALAWSSMLPVARSESAPRLSDLWKREMLGKEDTGKTKVIEDEACLMHDTGTRAIF